MKHLFRRSISTSVVLGLLLSLFVTANVYAAGKTVEVNGSPWEESADFYDGDLTSQLSVSNVVETFDGSDLGKDYDACFKVESPSKVTILTENGARFDVFKLTKTGTEFTFDEGKPLPVSGYYDNGVSISEFTLNEGDTPPLYMPASSVTLTEPGDYYVYFSRDADYADTEVFITVKGANDATTVEPSPTKPNTAEPQTAISFSDVSKDAWYYNPVSKLVAKGAITGYKDAKTGVSTFKPNGTITNAEFLTILMKATQNGTYEKLSATSHWASGVIAAANKAGVVATSELQEKDYNTPITRVQMALYTERAISMILQEDAVDITGIEARIKDFSKIKGPAYAYVVECVYARGIMTGDTNGNFNPDNNATRAEASAIILRTIDAAERINITK